MRKWIAFTLVAGAAMFVFAAPHGATGEEEGPGIEAQGWCDLGSKWTVGMAREIGLAVEAMIETKVPGVQWHITVTYNRHILISQIEETEEDGAFEVVKVENNAKGDDIGHVKAVNLETGERCWGKVRGEL